MDMVLSIQEIIGTTVSPKEGMNGITTCGKSEGKVSNPLVGCVVVRDGTIIGAGYHARVGQWHAERSALMDMQARGVSAEGATLFVNLEPCCHGAYSTLHRHCLGDETCDSRRWNARS